VTQATMLPLIHRSGRGGDPVGPLIGRHETALSNHPGEVLSVPVAGRVEF
jgi:hypothetical protein